MIRIIMITIMRVHLIIANIRSVYFATNVEMKQMLFLEKKLLIS